MITPPAKLASGEKHIIFPFVKYVFIHAIKNYSAENDWLAKYYN